MLERGKFATEFDYISDILADVVQRTGFPYRVELEEDVISPLFYEPCNAAMTTDGVLEFSSGISGCWNRRQISAVLAHELGHFVVDRSIKQTPQAELQADAYAATHGFLEESLETLQTLQKPGEGIMTHDGVHPTATYRVQRLKELKARSASV